MMSSHKIINLLILTAISISGCSAQQQLINSKVVYKASRISYGKASWYGKKFEGKKTASGELFRVNKKTAAHRVYPFGTKLRVTNLTNNRSVIVRVNDRGPYSKKRILDISESAANEIGLIKQGIADVKVELINPDSKQHIVSLPTSTQRCENGDCQSTLVKSNNTTTSSVKPFNHLPSTANSNRVSVYGEKLLSKAPKSSKHYNSKIQVTNQSRRAYTLPKKVIQDYPKVTSYNKHNYVQIGAFRNQAGATTCASRYSLLSRQYKAIIRDSILDQKIIYRVHIEGFTSESEARRFIAKHKNSLSGAFLVRR